MKYIYPAGDGYQILKSINGKLEYFGYFTNYNDAVKEVELLINAGWNWEDLIENE